jgi:hypothetical protein
MDARLWIAVLIVVGFALTASNGVGAFLSAKRRLGRLGQRISSSQKYIAEQSDAPVSPGMTSIDFSAHEAVEVVLHALQSSRTNLTLAGVGLLISTVASLMALFVST